MGPSWVAFALLAVALILMPGPDTVLVTRNTLIRGRKSGWLTVSGVMLGCTIHAAGSALGLSAILARSATLFHSIKTVGAIYLIWLGVQTLLAARREGVGIFPTSRFAENDPLLTRSRNWGGCSFQEGILTNLLNPKVSLFYLMVLPQFIDPAAGVLSQSLLLAGTHIGLSIVWLLFYIWFIDSLKQWLARPAVKRCMECVTGFALIGFGIRVALERAPRAAV